MPSSIMLVIGDDRFPAELDDTPQTGSIMETLPLERDYATWGDEIYFPIPVELSSPHMVESVAVGDIAYWPPGNAFCVFYGMTPMSTPDDIRPASAVIPLGRVTGDMDRLKAAANTGRTIRIEQA